MIIRKTVIISLYCAMFLSAQDQLPEAPAKKTVVDVCTACHDIDTAIEMRHDKAGWKKVIDDMVRKGADASDQEFTAIADYLSKYFGAVNVNTAAATDISDVLGIPSDQAAAIVQYRTTNGDFKDLDGLKKVPGLDAKVIDSRKDRILFN
jgi:competence protein ComEA